MLKFLFALTLLILSIAEPQAQNVTKEVYKKTPTRDLTLKIYSPSGLKQNDKRPAIVFFFGGGWNGRNCKCLRYFGTWQTSQKHRSCGASENSR